MHDPQDLRTRIVGALGAVLAVALVIGLVAGVVAYGAVRASGLGDDEVAAAPTPAAATADASSDEPSPSRSASPSPTSTPTPTEHAEPEHEKKPKKSEKHKKSHHRHHHHGTLTLSASPGHVSRMGRIDLRGRYPGHGGAYLQVQRRQGGHWERFPVGVTVRGGRFHTWVASGHGGDNHFRVRDLRTGRVSPAVTVRVG